MNEDFSESNDLAAKNPEKVKEMQALFMKEAEKYRVLPIDDRSIERFDPAIEKVTVETRSENPAAAKGEAPKTD